MLLSLEYIHPISWQRAKVQTSCPNTGKERCNAKIIVSLRLGLPQVHTDS